MSRIESIARGSLYANATFEVAFNPIEYDGSPEVVDLSYDLANIHQITHFKTAEVRELLASAKLIVADSTPLANLIKELPGVIVTPLPYGRLPTTREPSTSEQTVVGLLAHDDIYLAAASFGRKLLTKLSATEQLVVLGTGVRDRLTVSNLEIIEVEDILEFAASVDVCLVPGHPDALISPTIATALAEAGCVFVYSVRSLGVLQNTGGGNFFIPDVGKVGDWNKAIKAFQNRNVLHAARNRNMEYFHKANENSKSVVPRISQKLSG